MDRPFGTLALASLLALGCAQASAAPIYRIKVLPPTPNGVSSFAQGLNDHNAVAGTVQGRDGQQLATVWQADGGVRAIGTLPGDELSQGLAIKLIPQ